MTHSVWSEAAARKQGMAVGYARDDNQQWQRGLHWRLGAGAAMGGLYSSLSDMTRYLIFQLNAWPPRNARDAAPVKR
ncbi:MAG TPA: serine hydrolase, partial [Myxococcales bacterium]|nr:serine hydrolase [Myxococcales bacterium]